MNNLEQYLLSRGITLDPLEIEKGEDLVLKNGELLKEVSEIWTGHKGAVTAVLQTRINAIVKEIINKATPPETIVLRQALVEIGAILNDFDKYSAEYARRDTEQSGQKVAEPSPVAEGSESSVASK